MPDYGITSLYSIGKGGAQVFQGNPALNYLQQQYALDAQRKQKQEAEYAAEFAKANYDAVRDADVTDAIKLYDGVKNTYSQIRNTSNPTQRALLAAKMSSQQRELAQFVNMSKQAGQFEAEIGKLPLTKGDEIDDSYYTKYPQIRKTPISHPDYQTGVQELERTLFAPKFDMASFINKTAPLAVDKVSGDQKERKITGGRQLYVEEGERFNPDSYVKVVVDQAKGDPNLRKQIARAYPDLDPAHATMQFAADLVPTIAPRYTTKEKVVSTHYDPKPDNWKEKADYNHSLRMSEKDAVTTTADERKQWIADIKNGVPGSGEKLLAFVEGNSNFAGDTKPHIGADPKDRRSGVYVIDIPAQIKQNTQGETVTVVPRTKFKVDVNEPNFEIKMNEIINSVTGQRMDIGSSTGLKGNTRPTKTTVTKSSTVKAQGGYKIGQEESGYVYVGGDPTDPKSWKQK